MPLVRFLWDPSLIDVRRDTCPRARFDKAGKRWIMTETEAADFVRAADKRLKYTMSQALIMIDQQAWVVGFVQDAPYCALGAPQAAAAVTEKV